MVFGMVAVGCKMAMRPEVNAMQHFRSTIASLRTSAPLLILWLWHRPGVDRTKNNRKA